jgi:head-tail adaptor
LVYIKEANSSQETMQTQTYMERPCPRGVADLTAAKRVCVNKHCLLDCIKEANSSQETMQTQTYTRPRPRGVADLTAAKRVCVNKHCLLVCIKEANTNLRSVLGEAEFRN